MSIRAGSIIHVGGNNVIDRIQSAGLGDVRVPTEVIREVGNREVVDKIQTEADFTFTLESFDTSTELEAWLTGQRGTSLTGSANGAGAADPDGTSYDWLDCKFVNITSPWKDPDTGSAGTVEAGHIVPGYYPTRIRYRFGVTDSATQEVELAGGSFYYAAYAPVEEKFTGTGAQTAFTTSESAVPHRIGGEAGSSFKSCFGVLVDGAVQVEGVDYTQSPSNSPSAAAATVTFTTAPANNAVVVICYFTTTTKSYPQTVHASTVVKPAAVRGRNICLYLGSGGTRTKLGGVQSFELEATVDSQPDREFCNEDIIGRTVNGTDCNGTVTLRAKDKDAFIAALTKITGVSSTEVFGFLNQHEVPLELVIQNPKNPAQTLKTLYVADAIFSVPGTPARVNQAIDFELRFESKNGTYKAYKGAK